MLGRDIEGRGHLPLLGAVPYQAGVAARTECQREGVEQDGFARAGFACEHRETRREIDVEPLDQYDVADRKPGQHDPVLS